MRYLRNMTAALLTLLLVSCAATKAKNGLVELMSANWPRIEAMTDRDPQKIAAAKDIQAMSDALDTKSPAAVAATPWAPVEASARRGVQAMVIAGELSELTADSLYETVRLFSEAWLETTK